MASSVNDIVKLYFHEARLDIKSNEVYEVHIYLFVLIPPMSFSRLSMSSLSRYLIFFICICYWIFPYYGIQARCSLTSSAILLLLVLLLHFMRWQLCTTKISCIPTIRKSTNLFAFLGMSLSEKVLPLPLPFISPFLAAFLMMNYLPEIFSTIRRMMKSLQ